MHMLAVAVGGCIDHAAIVVLLICPQNFCAATAGSVFVHLCCMCHTLQSDHRTLLHNESLLHAVHFFWAVLLVLQVPDSAFGGGAQHFVMPVASGCFVCGSILFILLHLYNGKLQASIESVLIA